MSIEIDRLKAGHKGDNGGSAVSREDGLENAGSERGQAFRSLEEIATALERGETTSVALTEYFLNRIATFNTQLHAYSETFADACLRQAAACDAIRHSGQTIGPLHGIPVAVKDIFDIAGLPTSAGSTALHDRVPEQSAFAVQRLIQAGMVVIGRTHMVEFAFGGWGTNPVMGAPRNPWDPSQHRVAGGSSSGSAVSVAAGLAPVALGTDTGGSVRTPAVWCGVIGLKTSHGLIGRGGVVPLCGTHDSVGWFSRTVRDSALLLNVLQGADPRDAANARVAEIDALAEIEHGIANMKIGRLVDADLAGVDPDILRLHDEALEDLEALGATIAPIHLPLSIADYLKSGGDIMSYESFRALGQYVEAESSPVDPTIRGRIMAGKSITDDAYRQTLQRRLEAQAEFADRIADYDALVMPGSHIVARTLTDVDESVPPNFYGRVVNFLDLAAVAAPTGLTSEGMPAGIQIVVRKFDDALALRIARALEKHRGGLVHVPAGY
ncbi:amidase [Pseudohoeflea coraliihabitans]|uniref:Indoleacetamide hydrolase n=1 Tax=Pseudohoeflea coraliihabitans TaxID=2860393 RepID=A0ABS6WJY8_9HYPH|nr:amidase [Pseudohoeflea sp. DP4N28-3]MBW3096262.1 amidase [Pseudohoeflea sp. DP4N28-3]